MSAAMQIATRITDFVTDGFDKNMRFAFFLILNLDKAFDTTWLSFIFVRGF